MNYGYLHKNCQQSFLECIMKIWSDEEVKNLFAEVEKCKEGGVSNKEAFEEHAQKYGRKANSVRNYYYAEVDNLKKDNIRAKRLQIEIEKHKKAGYSRFDKEQESDLLKQVKDLEHCGFSVRSACQKISGGNLTLMTRLQNKYQNLKKKSLRQDNVVMFSAKQKTLSESDLNSLFLGLVKLIKKTAVEEIEQKVKLERQSSNFLLKKAFIDLNKKDKKIGELSNEFEILKSENQKLNEKLTNYLKERKSIDKKRRIKN